MKFGIFDHLDESGLALSELYENRLRLAQAYDAAGFYCYHLAEHHFTPLGTAPSPSVFLSALAQRTRRLRFGPLVYTLALYHPLRLAEEVCMLDHLSRGRMVLGVGRGVSPVEMGLFGVDPDKAQSMYMEAYEVLMKALTQDALTHEGTHYNYRNVPIRMRPLQQPAPPLWYGLGNPDGVEWVAQNRINVISLAATPVVRRVTDGYRAAWAAAGRPEAELPLLGTLRHTVLAPTTAEALVIARRAYARWRDSFWHLWEKFNRRPRFAIYPDTFDELLERGQALAGSPQAVREALAAEAKATGVNYLLLDVAFGDMQLQESLQTIELFRAEVMPAVS
jgi:alkanesulfonate monooxygenase SsuD/methylene tetrahydromethanopterin reductase-like flavin-dependent oxidoreductase (luciferase family)